MASVDLLMRLIKFERICDRQNAVKKRSEIT